MADPLAAAKRCELHVHTGGCFYAEDLLELGREVYRHVDWTLFTEGYQEAYGVRPDPVALFEEALTGDAAAVGRFRDHFVYRGEDGGDFGCFQAKFNLIVPLVRYWWLVLGREAELTQLLVRRHRREGLQYVEYRSMAPASVEDPETFIHFHRTNAEVMAAESGDGFEARYIISLPRQHPVEGYELVQRLFDLHPGLIPTVVGLDFCFYEEGFPPKTVAPLFERLRRDNAARPGRALEVVYHVGESFFDKSLESAVRWCHEIAELGARRLGHCIALGLDPAVAVARRPGAHTREPTAERLDQIAYDLQHAEALAAYGIKIDRQGLEQEKEALRKTGETVVQRPYDEPRLAAIRRRQDFALDRLAALGAAVETCPASNLRIGGVPHPEHHPAHRFIDSPVDLVISADDPGIFDAPLATEVDWLRDHGRLDAEGLAARLGDPRRLALGRLRPTATA